MDLKPQNCYHKKMFEARFSVERRHKLNRLPSIPILACFGISIPLFVYLVGDLGFQGDDWWIFGIPYWNSFPESLMIYARESKRPIEGLYWISMYEVFGFREPAFLAGSLLLLAFSCVLMSKCLYTAFPDHKDWAVSSGMLAFVITPLANLVFMLHTDNSRISCLFFWASVLFFQNWARHSSSILRLCLAGLFYCLATLTYENCALLIFSVPFFTFPVLKLSGGDESTRKFFIKQCSSILLSFGVFLAIRFVIFEGGAVGHRTFTPPMELGFSYIRMLLAYLSYPLTTVGINAANMAWACLFTLMVYLVSDRFNRNGVITGPDSTKSRTRRDFILMALLSFSVLGLGMAPYLLAGYSPQLGFTSQSRIFSSAGFGAAAIICLPLVFWRGTPVLGKMIRGLLLVFVFFNALSQISLRTDWIQAATHRENITRSLLSKIPAINGPANFFFLDLQWYISSKAVVFQGVDGINEWIKIIYDNRQLHAYFLYPPEKDQTDYEEKSAIITPRGISARGSGLCGPSPLDSLVLMERKGDELEVVKSLSRNDNRVLAGWEGIDAIETNQELLSGK